MIKDILKKLRKIDWDDEAVFNGKKVEVIDVDLKGKVDFDNPLIATVRFKDELGEHEIEGSYWPPQIKKPEYVKVYGVKKPVGKVGFSGKFKFLKVKIKLRFRYWDTNTQVPDDQDLKYLEVQGDISVFNATDLLSFFAK